MKGIFITILSLLALLSVGCVTIGSKDLQMIKTVAGVLESEGKISSQDSKILGAIIDKYLEEEDI